MKQKYAYIVNILWSEEDQAYIAEAPELEGCITHGKTITAAAKNANDAITSWMRTAKRLKHPIPDPVLKKKPSGKFNVRVPKQLHQSLVVRAVQEGVSLNQIVVTLLAQGV
ncbi:MAG: toxin-antitoxin system HicB family antitoxin [bacterium]|nr:toxin-antitoxin system HicB family antitoxin [bacterium]MBU1918752.1 toxin-antitoxin system HicB family antitoxin [bacterium]